MDLLGQRKSHFCAFNQGAGPDEGCRSLQDQGHVKCPRAPEKAGRMVFLRLYRAVQQPRLIG